MKVIDTIMNFIPQDCAEHNGRNLEEEECLVRSCDTYERKHIDQPALRLIFE